MRRPVGMGWLTGSSLGGGRVDQDQVLRLLGEREAASRAEMARLEQEAGRIAGLIEECRREAERLAVAREVVSGLVAEPEVAAVAGQDVRPDEVVTQRVLAVLAGSGPVRCRDVAAALGEDPAVARHVERVRHRLKKLVAAGRVAEPEPGLFTIAGDLPTPPG
jgi:siroheme synthase